MPFAPLTGMAADGDGDCGICLQSLARLVDPAPAPCRGLNFARRAELDGCSHVFCLACISRWAGIATSCPSCRAPFGEVSMLDDDGEVLQRIQYEQRQAQASEDDVGASADSGSEGSGAGSEDAEEELDDYVEFLDDFVVPDDTIHVEDDAAPLPSPSAYGRGRRRRQGRWDSQPLGGAAADVQEAGSSVSRQGPLRPAIAGAAAPHACP